MCCDRLPPASLLLRMGTGLYKKTATDCYLATKMVTLLALANVEIIRFFFLRDFESLIDSLAALCLQNVGNKT